MANGTDSYNVITAADIIAANPEQQRKWWEDRAIMAHTTLDEMRLHEGGPDSIVETKNSLAKGGVGEKIVFGIANEYFNDGIRGATLLADGDFEGDSLAHDQVSLGLVTNGCSEHTYDKQQLPMEILSGKAGKMGRWMGRKRATDRAMTTIHTCHPSSRFIKGHTHLSEITSRDEFEYNDILQMSGKLSPMGGRPARIKTDSNGGFTLSYHVIPHTHAFTALKADPVVQNMNMRAAPRNERNPVFTGELYDLDGTSIQHHHIIDHTGAGPIGSAWAPRAFLGTAIAAGTTAVAITGGRNATNGAKTRVKYFQNFPLNQYPFANYLSLDNRATNAAASSTLTGYSDAWNFGSEDRATWNTTPFFYVTIVNPSWATVQPNKWSIYKCTANDGNQLTMIKRLGATVTGIQDTTVGNVPFDSNVHATSHASGSLIYLSTPTGLPLCMTPMYGAGALRLAKGIWDNSRHEDLPLQGVLRRSYIRSVWGFGCTHDEGGQTPGLMLQIHTYKMEGWNIPVV